MGLLKAGVGALGGVLADQWREYFYCDSISDDILLTKGEKRTSGRSSNTKASDNIISNGSIICVADGQAMAIIDQGKIVEFSAEPGEYVFDQSSEPTIMYGGLNKENIMNTLKTVGTRFTFGGDTAKDQRVYYFNTKEIYDNKFGTATPIPFRVVQQNPFIETEVDMRMNGTYVYRLTDPLAFYKNIAGNVSGDFRRDQLATQMKAELLAALNPALAKISEAGVRYSAVTAHTLELGEELKKLLAEKWARRRGLELIEISIASATISDEDAKKLKMLQTNAALRDPSMRDAQIAAGLSEGLAGVGQNGGGGVAGVMGIGMMGNMAGNMFATGYGNQQQQYGQGYPQQQYGQPQQTAPAGDSWTCACGQVNSGKFCMNCGNAKPAPVNTNSWTCSCGQINNGKFCMNCGSPAPAADWVCSCGQTNSGKFCMNCGKAKNNA